MPTAMQPLFDQVHKLPQIPEVVRTLINQLNDPSADFIDVAQNVEKEQVIALKILRLVNSAHFGLSRKIGSIKEAASILGMNQLQTLVIASGLVCAMPKVENFDIKQFWNDSFLSAAYAKWFAEQTELAADVAYTAGLLCNLGNLLIHIGMPSEANEIDQHFQAGHHTRSEIEFNRLGFNSQMVCAELCRRWKFAPELIETIEQSDHPLASTSANKLACCVFLARYISESLHQNKSLTEIQAAFPLEIASVIGFSNSAIDTKLAEVVAIESKLEGLAD